MKNMGRVIAGFVKVFAVIGAFGGIVYYTQNKLKEKNSYIKRYRMYYELTNQWLLNKFSNNNAGAYFEKKNYTSIAVYGQGTLGELFSGDIKNQNVKIEYFIDKNADGISNNADNIPVVGIEDIADQNKVDAIVVTPIANYDEIVGDLENAGIECDIISLEDVIYGI